MTRELVHCMALADFGDEAGRRKAVHTLREIIRDTAASPELAIDALDALKVAIPTDGDAGDSAFIRVARAPPRRPPAPPRMA